MAINDGLEAMGLGGMDAAGLYDDNKKKAQLPPKAEPKKTAMVPVLEKDLLFDKKYECPVCSKPFTAKTVRTGKVRATRTDYDLRQVSDVIDQVKYETVSCPRCGYSVVLRYHGTVTDGQCKLIRENIASKFRPQEWGTEIYTYEEARMRYQLSLANAMARGARASEKAYICLKMGWLMRGEKESLEREGADDAKIRACAEAEQKYLGQALDGFEQARQTENYPVAGMDEKTLDYLMSALYLSQKRYQDCARFLGNILTSKNITSNLRTKAEDLKEMLTEEMNRNKPV